MKTKTVKQWSDFKKLTFKVRVYRDGEWIAQCNEVSGIITGGHLGKGMVGVEGAICAAMAVNKLPKGLKITYSL